jgi:hypothetical protein
MRAYRSYSFSMLALIALLGTPALAAAPTTNIVIGVNGHNAWNIKYYDRAQEDASFKLLSDRNLRSYRVDINADANGKATLQRLVALGKKYNIAIRPMLYLKGTNLKESAYDIAKTFAADIKIWELGNELNWHGPANFDADLKLVATAREGILQAAKETGQSLKTTLNVTAGLNDIGLNKEMKSYPFIDRAIALNIGFDYLSFHYYPNSRDRTSGWMGYYLKPLRQYNKPVILNETNCAQIYSGDDGNSLECSKTLTDIVAEVKANYADIVFEINAYEMYDNGLFADGPEGHFGLLYDINRPKRTLDAISAQAVATILVSPYPEVNRTYTANGRIVRLLFERGLKRQPDMTGLVYWTGRMDVGAITGEKLHRAFVNSAEYTNRTAALSNRQFVDYAFSTVLFRTKGATTDPVGWDWWTKQLDNKNYSRTSMLDSLLRCAEYKKNVAPLIQ